MNIARFAFLATTLALTHVVLAAATAAPVLLVHSGPEYVARRAVALGAATTKADGPLTAQRLAGVRVLSIVAPKEPLRDDERAAVRDFVGRGGSLLIIVDDDGRQPRAREIANPLLAPYGMEFTAQIPYVHNVGAIAGPNVINAKPRELPFSGGRAVNGGTPFSRILDTPDLAHAAFVEVAGGGRVVAMGEAMVALGLGKPEGVRLSGVPNDPSRTTYWGKDSQVFMDEVLGWLLAAR